MKYRIMDYRFRLLASAAISCMVFFSCEEPEMPAAGQEGEKEEEVPDDGFTVPVVKPVIKYDRALWASINGRNDAADKEYASYNNTVLVSWRLYPGEEETAAFDIYRKAAGGEKVKLNDEPVTDATCWQDKSADLSVDNTYYLHMADDRYEVDSYTLKAERAASGLPYVSVFLKGTADVPGSATYSYDPNDISVGDLDGDGTITTEDRYFYHSPTPDYMLGFSTSVRWKNLTLSTSLRANIGNYAYNATAANNGALETMKYVDDALFNLSTSYLDTGFRTRQLLSDYYVENASFLKMDNLTLNYNFGKIKDTVGLNLSFMIQNVFTITKYSGIDPEIYLGVDQNFYPRPRIYSLGIGLTF